MSERFENTPNLFGCGSGVSTCGDIECDFCGRKYNEGEDERGVYDNESVVWTDFAGLCACECCFHRIESEVLNRIGEIIPWYKRWLDKRMADCNLRHGQLVSLEKSESRSGSMFVVVGRDSGMPIGYCKAESVLGLIEETPSLRFEPLNDGHRKGYPTVLVGEPMEAGQTRYWAVLSGYTKEVIGKTQDKDAVLCEEPKATFREITREEYFRDT